MQSDQPDYCDAVQHRHWQHRWNIFLLHSHICCGENLTLQICCKLALVTFLFTVLLYQYHYKGFFHFWWKNNPFGINFKIWFVKTKILLAFCSFVLRCCSFTKVNYFLQVGNKAETQNVQVVKWWLWFRCQCVTRTRSWSRSRGWNCHLQLLWLISRTVCSCHLW